MENWQRSSLSASARFLAFMFRSEGERRAHIAAIANRLTERHIHRGEN